MRDSNLWLRAKDVPIQTSADIVSGFDIGFDNKIPEETQNELRKFVKWVEDNFNVPITLWVDFEYKHYLLRKDRKRVGYLFYWADFFPTLHFRTKRIFRKSDYKFELNTVQWTKSLVHSLKPLPTILHGFATKSVIIMK